MGLKQKKAAGLTSDKAHARAATIFLITFILIGIAMTPQLNKYGDMSAMITTENEFMYEKSIHIMVMLLMGFGFLMVFVKKYGYTSITATYLVVALSLPLYMLIRPYLWGGKRRPSNNKHIYAPFCRVCSR